MITQLLKTFCSGDDARSFLMDLESLVHNFSAESIKDARAKDALIDSIIDYLKTLKDKQNG